MAAEKMYEIMVHPEEIFLRVMPPQGTQRANLTEIQRELKELSIPFRPDDLFNIFRRASNQPELLSKRESREYQVIVTVSPEGEEAHLKVFPPHVGDDQLTAEKIRDALEKAKVEKGIFYDVIKRVLAEKIENKTVLVAKGKPCIHGRDGQIDFMLEDSEARVRVEDNVADYKEMNLIKNVQEGDLIGKIILPTKGEDGFAVSGKVLKGKNGTRAKFRVGKNAQLNEDGTEIYAEKPGYVVVTAERISVENVLELKEVNSKTGNIRFAGVVRVSGPVEDNFIVEAEDGIEVTGSVGKAHLKSFGDIVIRGGVNGGKLESGKSVSAKFFSECEVRAHENVSAEDYILHSTIEAGKAIRVVKTPDGFLTGGLARAGEMVFAANIGSDVSEEKTAVEVGTGLGLRREFEALKAKSEHNRANFEKIRKNVLIMQKQWAAEGGLKDNQAEVFEKLTAAAKTIREELLTAAKEHHRLLSAITGQTDGKAIVFVPSIVNAGSRIQIKRFRLNVTSPLESCAFRIQNNEMKLHDFADAQRIYKMQYGKLPV